MPIDRRTFVLGSSVTLAGGAFASLAMAATREAAAAPDAAAAPRLATAAASSSGLRIVGWDSGDDPMPLAPMPGPDAPVWIAIDSRWRGAWH